jgi:hypothetical protein
MLDLAIVLTATTLALFVVTIRSFGRALGSRQTVTVLLDRKPQ